MPERLLGSGFRVQGSGFVRLLAVGKAAPRMAVAAIERLGRDDLSGVVIAPERAAIERLDSRELSGIVVSPASGDRRLDVLVAGHPVPDVASERAGRAALALADAVGPGDTLVVLLSGGASALMAAPAEGVTLEDKRDTTARLLAAGADIHALNAVRKHLSAIKGGWLAARCRGRTAAFAISDVVGDEPSVIGSGPTVGDPSTFGDALEVLGRFGGAAAYRSAVVRRLERGAAGEFEETPKPGDARLARAATVVIGSRVDAMRGAAAEASARGFHVTVLPAPTIGEARVASPAFVRAALGQAGRRPACVIASGETTVRVTGRGRGGRNQEFALAAATLLAGRSSPSVLASVGTDGIDGPTAAAGAIADDSTLDRAAAAALPRPEAVLAANDSHTFFANLGDLVQTGPTGTNVGDLQVFLLA